MKRVVLVLFQLLLVFLSQAESFSRTQISHFEYNRNGCKYFICMIDVKNISNEDLWLWFDERKKQLTNREIAEYFFRKPDSPNAMSLVEQAFDGNVWGPPALFATFITEISAGSSFHVNLVSNQPIDESIWLEYLQIHKKSRIIKVKDVLSLLDTKLFPFYQSETIVIDASVKDDFVIHTHLTCKPLWIQDPNGYE